MPSALFARALAAAALLAVAPPGSHGGHGGGGSPRCVPRCGGMAVVAAEPLPAVLKDGMENREGEEEEAWEEELYSDEAALDFLHEAQAKAVHRAMDADGDGGASYEEVRAFATRMRAETASRDVYFMLGKHDANEDGRLDRREVFLDEPNSGQPTDVWETRKFAAADANNDGYLSADEYLTFLYPQGAVLDVVVRHALSSMDKDGDGSLSPTEFGAYDEEMRQDFAALDRDGDGRLNLAELAVWESRVLHREKSMRELVRVADKDRDGRVTLQELLRARGALTATPAHHFIVEWTDNYSEL